MAERRNSGLMLRLLGHKHAATLSGISLSHGYSGRRPHRNRARIDGARQTVLWLGKPLYNAVVGAFTGKLLRLSVYSDLRNRDPLSVHAMDRSFLIFPIAAT